MTGEFNCIWVLTVILSSSCIPFLWAGATAALPAKAFDPVVEVMIVICAGSS